MLVQILVDNPKSWVVPYAQQLLQKIKEFEPTASLIHSHHDIQDGDVLALLSCERIIKADLLKKNRHNLVVHASPLPKGKGMSPLTWQILEGKNDIPVTLFEAVPELDAGDIYLQEIVRFNGDELIDEMRIRIAEVTNNLILHFLKDYENMKGIPQSGDATFYQRRRAEDSRLDVHKTIAEQFNLLRVVDNERYPAFFEMNGCTYIVKIEKK